MNYFLGEIPTEVVKNEDLITVTYCQGDYSGSCLYRETVIQGETKRFKRRIHILVEVNMGDIIEWLYKEKKITGSDDLPVIHREIMEHSRMVMEKFIT